MLSMMHFSAGLPLSLTALTHSCKLLGANEESLGRDKNGTN